MDRGGEGTSLTVAQTNGSPVLALSATFQGVRSAPMDTVGDAAEAVVACGTRRVCTNDAFPMRFFAVAALSGASPGHAWVGRTLYHG